MGKEWTTASGEFVHHNPMWVKVVSPHGEVHSKNWITNYKRLREALNIEFPGMLTRLFILYIKKFILMVFI